MTRRKLEIAGLANEQDFPYLVELTFPPGGFRSVFLEIDAFHRERRIPVRRGRNRHEVEKFHIRFCFSDTATADAFRNRFGDECLTHAPAVKRSRGRLGKMTRRKREITGLANEQDFPHLVELALPPGGFRSVFLEFDAFHRQIHPRCCNRLG